MRSQRAFILAFCAICALALLQPATAAASAEGSFQRTLQVSGGANIDLKTGSGSVEVRTGNTDQVSITGHIKATNWFGGDAEALVKRIEDNPPIQQNGNEIQIGQNDDSDLMHNVSISYELTVPPQTELRSHTGSGSQRVEGLRGSVELQSGSGAIKASDIGNALRAETGSGDIDIEGVQGNVRAKAGSGTIHANNVAGELDAQTGSGHISAQLTAPGSVRAETGSGGMDLRGVKGSVKATAGSGTIEVEGSPSGSWQINTGSGGARVRMPSDAAFDLDAHTSSGSISVQQPVTVQGTLGRKELRGTVRGGGPSVSIQTGSGNIEIE